MSNKESIVITGGLGFIGQDAVKLLSKKYEIVIVDDLSSNCILFNDFPQEVRDNCHFMPCNIQQYKFEHTPPKYIYHYASPVGPAGILKHPGKIGTYIIRDLSYIIEQSLKFRSELIFISTSEVYGKKNTFTPLKETDVCNINPPYTVRNEYAQAKLLAEIMLQNTSKIHPEFKYHIFRPFNVCGPYQKPDGGFVIPRFIQAAIKNDPLTVFGEGGHIRSFVHVRDINNAIQAVVEQAKPNNIWNVGNLRNTLSIQSLAEQIISLAESKSILQYTDPQSIYGPLYADAWDKVPDITKISKNTDWEPTMPIEDIILDTLRFWKNRL